MSEKRTRTFLEEKESVDCPICDIDQTRPFLPGFSNRIVKCERCGLIYVNPRRATEKVSEYFMKEYISDKDQLHQKFTDIRAPALALEADFIKRFKDHGRILDVGCASGEFLRRFVNDKRWLCEGIEPSLVAASEAQSLGVRTRVGLLEDFQLEPKHYDVISVIDTLFLTAWPLRNLLLIKEALKDDGVLAVEIPGFAFRMARNIGPISLLINRRWIHMDENSPHLFYFSPRTIRRLLLKAGFCVESELPVPSPSYGSWIFRLLMKLYHLLAVLLFKISFRRLNLAAKSLLICRKIRIL